MNEAIGPQCPRIDDISALIDNALAEHARDEIAAHAAGCPLCGATLRDFTAMRSRLQQLRGTHCTVDIASLIEDRLPPRARAQGRESKRGWDYAWQVAPRGLAAAGVLAAGVYLGLLLAGGTSVMRPAALAVFDPAPPGALCAGQPWCGLAGR
jgi:anti-sigma factor RsiW